MISLNIEPTVEIFQNLIRASAEAPFWVNGYQDTIFEALRKMEGYELIPNDKIYGAIIYAFGRANDAKAAEYYFWEMRQKGIPQNAWSYNALLNAYARSQLVGAKKYGYTVRIFSILLPLCISKL